MVPWRLVWEDAWLLEGGWLRHSVCPWRYIVWVLGLDLDGLHLALRLGPRPSLWRISSADEPAPQTVAAYIRNIQCPLSHPPMSRQTEITLTLWLCLIALLLSLPTREATRLCPVAKVTFPFLGVGLDHAVSPLLWRVLPRVRHRHVIAVRAGLGVVLRGSA